MLELTTLEDANKLCAIAEVPKLSKTTFQFVEDKFKTLTLHIGAWLVLQDRESASLEGLQDAELQSAIVSAMHQYKLGTLGSSAETIERNKPTADEVAEIRARIAEALRHRKVPNRKTIAKWLADERGISLEQRIQEHVAYWRVRLVADDQQNFVPVQSSVIHSIRYDAELQLLYIIFMGGAKYAYEAVPQEAYDAFLATETPGKHFNAEIRTKYTVKRLS